MPDPRLKRLSYRAWHRGTRELDIILGRFADAHLGRMDQAALAHFEALLDCADPDLAGWIVRGDEPDAAVERALIVQLRESLATLARVVPK